MSGHDTVELVPTNLVATMERLKQIAAAAGDRLLLSDGPPHPDHKLLDICADVLSCMKRYEALVHAERGPGIISSERAAEMLRLQGAQRTLLSQARKLSATTGAGIYAKALVIRSSCTGAGVLAKTLAEDLMNAPSIRAGLWGSEPDAQS